MPAFSALRAETGALASHGLTALSSANGAGWQSNNVNHLHKSSAMPYRTKSPTHFSRPVRNLNWSPRGFSQVWGQGKPKPHPALRVSSTTRSAASEPPEAFNFQSTASRGDEIPESNVLVGPPPVEFKRPADIEYLQELLAIQQSGPKAIGFFGTRNMGFMHQQLIEILSYAMVLTSNHIITSGATGTNAAVIRGALRAEKPDLLTVVLPQSLSKQPPESQELLKEVKNLVETPQNDHLPLIEASRLCNRNIISRVQQIICFAFHDSHLLMETCQEAKDMRKIVTLLYLD